MKHLIFLFTLFISLGASAQTDSCKCRCVCDTTTNVEAQNIVFFGSSTVFLWNVSSAFPGYPVKKAGFGGKTWAGLALLTDTIKKLKPKQVVIYSGDNDVIARRSVSLMTADIQNLIKKIWAENDSVEVVFLYTKPSDTAFKITYPDGVTKGVQAIEYTNRNVTAWGNNYPGKFRSVDTYSINLLWNPKRINTQLYNSDRLHLNQTYGYPKWNAVVQPVLKTD